MFSKDKKSPVLQLLRKLYDPNHINDGSENLPCLSKALSLNSPFHPGTSEYELASIIALEMDVVSIRYKYLYLPHELKKITADNDLELVFPLTLLKNCASHCLYPPTLNINKKKNIVFEWSKDITICNQTIHGAFSIMLSDNIIKFNDIEFSSLDELFNDELWTVFTKRFRLPNSIPLWDINI